MTDEKEYLKKKFGRKINTEEEGFTEVDYDGIARPVLKIPATAPKGRRRITAVYTDERQKVYKPSLNRTIVIYGTKCYVHCPTIYQPTNLTSITLFANLFANNRPVPAGNANFKLENKKVGADTIEVSQGYVEETIKKSFKKDSFYECFYEANETLKISEGTDMGNIIVYDDNKTPLIVYVAKIITNRNEATRLVARVTTRNHGNVVNYPDDIPKSGKVAFYIDGERYGAIVNMKPDGFATVPYRATHDVGVHNIVAIYFPDTDEMKQLYQKTSGANTLFIGDDTNKPTLTQLGANCASKGEQYTFQFKTSRKITGKLRLYLGGTTIHANECEANGTINFMGNKQTLYEQTVENVATFNFTINIPRTKTDEYNWAYGGKHNLIVQYIEPDEELGDMEYWYYLTDFYIQYSTNVYIDDTFMDNTSDNEKYTGNNMFIENSEEITHFTPTEKQVPHSITVGNPLKIHVENEDSDEKINVGTVKVTVTTRKKETWVN